LLRYLRQDRILNLVSVVGAPCVGVILGKTRVVVVIDGDLLPNSDSRGNAQQERAQRKSNLHGFIPSYFGFAASGEPGSAVGQSPSLRTSDLGIRRGTGVRISGVSCGHVRIIVYLARLGISHSSSRPFRIVHLATGSSAGRVSGSRLRAASALKGNSKLSPGNEYPPRGLAAMSFRTSAR